MGGRQCSCPRDHFQAVRRGGAHGGAHWRDDTSDQCQVRVAPSSSRRGVSPRSCGYLVFHVTLWKRQRIRACHGGAVLGSSATQVAPFPLRDQESPDEGVHPTAGTTATTFSPGRGVSVQNRYAAIAEDEVKVPVTVVHVMSDGSGTTFSCQETEQVHSAPVTRRLRLVVGPCNTSRRSGRGRSSAEHGNQDWRSPRWFRHSTSSSSAAMVAHHNQVLEFHEGNMAAEVSSHLLERSQKRVPHLVHWGPRGFDQVVAQSRFRGHPTRESYSRESPDREEFIGAPTWTWGVPDGDSFKHFEKMLHFNSKSCSGAKSITSRDFSHLFLRLPGLQHVECGVSFRDEGRSSQHVPGSGDLTHLDFRLCLSPSLFLFLLDCGGTLGRG